jgi:undecaprenyl-diphosphatase
MGLPGRSRDVVSRRGRTRAKAASASAIWLVIAAIAIIGFAALTLAIKEKVVFPFDQPLLTLMHAWPVNALVWNAITETANYPLYVIAGGFVIWLLVKKRRREAFVVLLLFAAVSATSEGVKQFTLRLRPEAGTANGLPGVIYSYPSGHVLESLTIVGSAALRIWRSSLALFVRIAAPVIVAVQVVLVGIARIALGAHYPTDVLAGFLCGAGALAIYAWLTRPGAWADEPPAGGS